MPASALPCDAFAGVGLSCDCDGHESEVHHSDASPIALADRPGSRIDLNGRLVRWDAEPGHPTEFEVVVDLGVELLEFQTPAAVREARTQLSHLTSRLDRLADQLTVLQNEQLRQAVADPETELGRLLAEHGIHVLVADGPNADALDEPLLAELGEDAHDTLLLPPGARLPDILEHVRAAIPQREANRAAGRPAWAENTAVATTSVPHVNAKDEAESEMIVYLAAHDLHLIRESGRSHIDICRLGNDLCIVVPTETLPEAVLECARKHVAGRSPVVKHGRKWTYIDRSDMTQRTATCTDFCRNDHSRDILTPTYAADIWHQDHGVGVQIPLSDTHELATPWRVLEPQLAVTPGADDSDGYQVPHVNIEFVEGVWSGPLGPDELADFIDALSDGLATLRLMHGKLVAARADWPVGA
ncbi:hypothetical protein AB0D74_03735 [Streptomyces sp. NPDC048278]|uniref:DUF6907 domain-containing protein n=1 Tax=Streptomyces sp. NPDC048278 TaxID=3155809 RepID=UPI00341336F5